MTYPSLQLSALPAAASGSETITLNGTAPTGLTIKFIPNSVKLSTDGKSAVGLTINASQSMTPGDYKIHIGTSYSGTSKTTDITVRVVQYLILEQGNAFGPSTLTVKQGSTVWWINLDSPGGGDAEIHNVVFPSGSPAKSNDMARLDAFSATFATPGTYSFFCAFHPGMTGTITVTA